MSNTREPDAIAAVRRVLTARNRLHAALLVSTQDVVAMAMRLDALEEAAATAFHLITTIDEWSELRPDLSGEHRARWLACHAAIRELNLTLADALTALGYVTEPADEESKDGQAGQEQGAGGVLSGAAE